MKVKITGAGGLNKGIAPWYKDSIGDVFEVEEMPKSSSNYAAGWTYSVVGGGYDTCGIAEHDCEIVKEEKFLEDAYDPKGYNHTFGKIMSLAYPETKYSTSLQKRKSVELIVSESYSSISDKNITEQDVINIVNLYSSLLKIKDQH